jgi:hypothetical protein
VIVRLSVRLIEKTGVNFGGSRHLNFNFYALTLNAIDYVR